MEASQPSAARSRTVDEELAKVQKNLHEREVFQARMKAVNAALRHSNARVHLDALGLSPQAVFTYIANGPYPDYKLANNNAQIRRLKGRLAALEEKASLQGIGTKYVAEFTTVKHLDPTAIGVVIANYALDRVQISFGSKPAEKLLGELRANGFKWAPSQAAWQRQLNLRGLYAAGNVLDVLSVVQAFLATPPEPPLLTLTLGRFISL